MSTQALIDLAKQRGADAERDKADARRLYFVHLRRVHSDTSGMKNVTPHERVLEYAEQAGFTVADLEGHVAVLEQAARLRAIADQLPDAERELEAAAAANKAIDEEKELAAFKADLQRRKEPLRAAASEAEARHDRCNRARIDLSNLIFEHPEILREQ